MKVDRVYTDDDKLRAVDQLISDLRWARNDSTVPENWTLGAMIALANDLRAKKPGAQNQTLDTLSFHINAAMRSKAQLGYLDSGHERAVSRCVLKHWPVVRKALENGESK